MIFLMCAMMFGFECKCERSWLMSAMLHVNEGGLFTLHPLACDGVRAFVRILTCDGCSELARIVSEVCVVLRKGRVDEYCFFRETFPQEHRDEGNNDDTFCCTQDDRQNTQTPITSVAQYRESVLKARVTPPKNNFVLRNSCE